MTIYLSVAGLIYMIILAIIFFRKKKVSSNEIKVYSILIIITLISLCTELLIPFCINIESTLLLDFVMKFYLVCMLVWTMLFTLYVYSLSHSENSKSKILLIMYIILNILISVILLILPIYLYRDASKVYSYGPSVNFLFGVSTVYSVLIVILTILDIKNIRKKQYVPVFVLLLLLSIAAAIQKLYPEVLIINFVYALTIFIMYHTIENPDMKMIEQLNIARDQAEKANRAKSDFLSSMSHEIRTPLNAIVGFSEAVKTSDTLEEAVENADDIITASGTLLEIVNGVLDISKIESGKLEIVNSNYNAHELFENVSKLIDHRIAEKALDFQVNIAPDLPERLYGDYANIKKIVTNLLSNAAKYTEQGYVKYDVNCIIKNDICRLIISVEDSGRGIKPEQMNKLFSKFQRLDEDKNTTVEGTGLGLAITKHLIEMMGGEIVVQSKYGEGSKFTVTLDQRISIEEKNVDNTISFKLNEIEIDIKDKKILVVDDNLLNLKVAKKALEPYTANIEVIESGFECLERLKTNQYDLILLDDMMPKMSGKETLVKIKEMGITIPVVALTANAISGEREKYMGLGFNEYLSKPIDKKELERVLKRIFYNINNKLNEDNKFESKFKDVSFEEIENMEDTVIVIKE